MASIFSKIISGEIPAHKIAENQDYLAFLDVFPLAEGHTLVVPKNKATDQLFDLEKNNYLGLLEFAYQIAPAIKQSFDCKRVGLSVVGLEVPHVHLHLVPINTADDLNFTRPKLQLTEERLTQIAKQIQSNLTS